jgi:beta-glucosidase
VTNPPAGLTIRVEYETGSALAAAEFGLRPEVRRGWQPPDSLLDDAAALAAQCDAAVVIVNQASGEGMDRQSLALPGDQDRLIAEIARHNPRTVIVLNTLGPAGTIPAGGRSIPAATSFWSGHPRPMCG